MSVAVNTHSANFWSKCLSTTTRCSRSNAGSEMTASGNPAKVVKQRFTDNVVAELLAIRWWDRPVDKITRNLAAIVGADLPEHRGAA
jgi:hypothetical protein